LLMTMLRKINKMLFVCFGFVLNCYLVVALEKTATRGGEGNNY
jgi:mannose/fructose/N-acetylgalactosamine-specific phosphotransferase system component IIC